jgi:dephospho-CoA kinase
MKVGITGGIGSGKSYVCKRLQTRDINVYDCDAAAKRLIRSSAAIREQLTNLIGDDAYVDGMLNKAAVARFLLESDSNAKAIDAIVHPAVFSDFESSGFQWMESAIMFESGIFRLVDKVVAVVAPEEIRIARVMQRDGISREKVLQWMQRQWSQEEVCRRADYIIVNDGIADIDKQIEEILTNLKYSL